MTKKSVDPEVVTPPVAEASSGTEPDEVVTLTSADVGEMPASLLGDTPPVDTTDPGAAEGPADETPADPTAFLEAVQPGDEGPEAAPATDAPAPESAPEAESEPEPIAPPEAQVQAPASPRVQRANS